MTQSLPHIEQELALLKESIHSLEKEIVEINKSISKAEEHVLNEDKINFWEPKLVSLRQDKVFMLKREEQLQDEALILDKSRLACLEAQSSEFGFFDIDGSDNTTTRERNATWAGGAIALSDALPSSFSPPDGKSCRAAGERNEEDVKKVESSPSIMTQVESDKIVNHDPNATLQGQNRRPHMGNLERKDSYNVFDVSADDEDMEPLPPSSGEKRDTKSSSNERDSNSGSSDTNDKPRYSVGKFLHEFFDASETLILAQGDRTASTDTVKSGSEDTFSGANVRSDGSRGVSNSSASGGAPPAIGLQPAVSTHDFSVFGAEMYNDSDGDDK